MSENTLKQSKIDMVLERFMRNYKINLLISLSLLILIIGFLSYMYLEKGDVVARGVDFKGGIQYLIEYNSTDEEIREIAELLEGDYPGIYIRLIENRNQIYLENVVEIPLERYFKDVEYKILSKRQLVSALAENFWERAVKLVIVAYILVTLLVFAIFRSPIPSFAVVLAGLSDILFTLSFMNIFNIPLTLSTITALLILIGYSIDTDILLTTRTLKSKNPLEWRNYVESMKTGITMSLTSIVAMSALLLFSTSTTLDRIAMVIIAGLIADMIFTWFQNASILRIYLERRYVNR